MAGEGDQGSQGTSNQASTDWGAWGTALGSLLGGIGGFFGQGGMSSGQKEDARWMMDFAQKQALRNEDFQKQLASQGIRMRVADAEAAGLHPLAALGAAPGGGSFGSNAIQVGGDSGGSTSGAALSNLGQNISRAASAMATPQEKAFKQLQLQKMATENEILNVELLQRRNALNGPGTGPGLAGDNAGYSVPGQPDSLRTLTKPSQMTASEIGGRQQTAGSNPIFDMYTKKRGFYNLMSQKAAESTEDDWLAKIGIHLDNLFSGKEGPATMTSRYQAPRGKRLAYGGPIRQYVEIPTYKETLWEAIHSIPRDYNAWAERRRNTRRYNFGNTQKSYYESGGRSY